MKFVRFQRSITKLGNVFIGLCLLSMNSSSVFRAEAKTASSGATYVFNAMPNTLLLYSTTRVSIATNGTESNNESNNPVIAADDRSIAFDSLASNLVSGDTNGVRDIFAHDMQTGMTTRISVDSNGIQGNNTSGNPAISVDGRFVAFQSTASNLVSGDSNGVRDVFIHDVQTGMTTRVSVDSNGIQGNNSSNSPSISTDGRYVAFPSTASNLVSGDTNGMSDIFVHDRQTGATTRVSIASSGVQANNFSSGGSLSGDGRYVAFYSSANNLVSGDTNPVDDVFLHDRQTGITTRVSVDSNGLQANDVSVPPAFSADGRYVVFYSSASNLVADDTNGKADVFVHDMQTGATTRVSVDSNGVQGNDHASTNPSISADGRYVVFESRATNMIADDTNGYQDIFVHENAISVVNISISGNAGTANATLNYTDGVPKTATSATDGSYSFTVSNGWSGTVTPSKTGYTFSPAYRTYANIQSNQMNQDFTASGPSLSIAHIQIIQGIQTTDDSVPLVEGKVTSIRLFLNCKSDCPRHNVTVTLEGPPGMTLTPINHSIDVAKVSNWKTQLGDLGKTLNYSLPPSSANGSFVLTAELEGITYIREVSFVRARPITIAYVPIRDEDYEPNAEHIRDVLTLMRKVYPTNEINYVQLPTWEWHRRQACYLLTYPKWIYSCLSQDLKSQLTRLYKAEYGDFIFGWLPAETYFYKILGDSNPTWLGGQGKAAWGIASADAILRNRIITHEVGHLLGAYHTNTGLCPDKHPGTDWPYSTPKIQDWGLDAYGFGWLLASNSALKNPATTFDYMSYCELENDTSWTSPFTFEKIYSDSLQAATSLPAVQSQANQQPYFVITGMVFADDTAALDPIWAENLTTPINPPAGTAYCLEAQGAGSSLLAQYCFDLSFMDYETGEMSSSAGFNINLPNPGGVDRIVLKKGIQELASRQVTPNSPQITVTHPNGGETWGSIGDYTITWNASDLDLGDTLSFNVYFSPDGSKWLPLGTSISQTQLTVNASELAGSLGAIVRVVASDGFNTRTDESDSQFTVAPKGPQVTIYSPEEPGQFSIGTPLLLDGFAFDLEDGILTGSSLNWSSNIDGVLGTGSPLQVYLSPGQHTLTLTATDSDQATGSREISVTVFDSMKFLSSDVYDGWILESGETSGAGGNLNKTAATLRVGDDAANRQYRSILAFDTSALPTNAIITRVALDLTYQGKIGTNPFDTHGKLLLDLKIGSFSSSVLLQKTDFQAVATMKAAGFVGKTPVSQSPITYEAVLSQAALDQLNAASGLTGLQLRLRFAKDDNNDFGADFLKIYSGNADPASQPQLIIEYYIP